MTSATQVSYYMGCISVAAILALLVSMSEAKSLVEQKVHEASHDIVKRNAWWSKKSMDESNRIGLDSKRFDSDIACENIKDTLECYTSDCVPEFVLCAQRSDSSSRYLQCQLRHKLCMRKCQGAISDSTIDDLLS